VSRVAISSPSGSIGIRTYAEDLATALRGIGVDAEVLERAHDRHRPTHVHLGNSTRALLPDLLAARCRHLVTLHDVVPRQPLLRALLAGPQAALLARHHVIVHSRHAERMLRDLGFRGRVDILHTAADPAPLTAERIAAFRERVSPDGRPILTTAGILRAGKGAAEVLRASADSPEFVFVFVGRAGDRETAELLARIPGNAVHIPEADDEEFALAIAGADLLLNLRPDSVGETSGPGVLAHANGTPIVTFQAGALPEYCGEGDVVFPAGTPVRKVLAKLGEAAARGYRVLPGDHRLTTWEMSARAHLALYEEYGLLTP
jgi:glycosyltransferase involved in cell wall biosynthesis